MKMLVALLCLVFALPGEAAEPLAGILACRALTDAAARLACFDRETAALASESAAALTAAPATAAPLTAAPATAAPPTAEPPTAAQATAATSAAAPAHPAPVLDAQQSFGLSGSAIAANEEASGARPPKVSKIESRVVALALTGNGRTLFTLDNKQVWRQLESEGDMLAKLGDTATISRGLLGSYWLQLKNGRGCKVTRER
jgi:cytoskeletal protein RodZ